MVPAHLEGWAPLPLFTHPGARPCLWIHTDPSLAFSLPIFPLSLSAPSSVTQPRRALTYLLRGELQGLAETGCQPAYALKRWATATACILQPAFLGVPCQRSVVWLSRSSSGGQSQPKLWSAKGRHTSQTFLP